MGRPKNSKNHGLTKHPLWDVWYHMNRRCYDVNRASYPNYGGRGITVHPTWKADFVAFRAWAIRMGWKPGLDLDRRDNNRGYCPTNCRFVTRSVNASNRRDSHRVTAFGETKTITDWSRDNRCTVNLNTFKTRILCGWNPEVALTNPPRRGKSYRGVV